VRDLGARRSLLGILLLLGTMLGCQALNASKPNPQPNNGSLALSDGTLDFGSVAVGSSKTLNLTLVNGTAATVTLTGAVASGSGYSMSAPQLPVNIAAGQQEALSFTFAPKTEGSSKASISISTNLGLDPLSLGVSGDAVTPGQLTANPASVNFGVVPVGGKQGQPIVLTNQGGASLTISQISASGSGFQVAGPNLPLTLDPGQSTSLSATFAPQTAGAVNGSISVTTGAGSQGLYRRRSKSLGSRDDGLFSIPLAGTGVNSGALTATPASVGFGDVVVGNTQNQTVTLTNSGSTTVTITQATASGAGFSVSGLNLPLPLAPGASTNFTASFHPDSAGEASGNVAVVSDAANSPLNVPLTGTGVTAGSLSANPAAVDFGSVQVGQSQKQSITLTNNGQTKVTISQATVSGAGFSISGLNLPLSLDAGQSTNFTAKFAPASPGSVSGNIAIVNDGETPTVNVGLTATGFVPGALAADPTSLSFGNIQVGNNQTLPETITNTGGAKITISQVNVTGAGFSVSGLTLPFSLNAGQSKNFSVTFAPQTSGTVSGNIAVVNNGSNPTLNIPLSGTGVGAAYLSPNPPSIDFGTVQVGKNSMQSETLTNTGGVTLTVSQATVSGSGFSISGLTLPLSLTPGQSFTFGVTFAPISGGNFSGKIALVSDASNPNLNIPLTGSGKVAGQLGVSPPSLDFGSVTVGQNKQLTGSLTATGASVTVNSYAIGSTEFTLSGLTFPFTLSTGQSAQFTVTFAPQMSGDAATTLSFASDAANSPTVENLTGTGVAAPQHSVDLSWNASQSQDIVGYNVYRGAQSGGPYLKINSGLDASTTYTDSSVQSGQTYYYVTTAVDGSGMESIYSNEAPAVIPSP